MDREVLAQLEKAGIDVTFTERVPVIPVEVEAGGKVVPAGEEVTVMSGEAVAVVTLKSIPELFTGARRPPSFDRGPTDEYVWFFMLIERTVLDVCISTGRAERDQEIERLYRHLRRRPAGRDANPLFSYMQAAARLYMSLRDVSRAEFDAVAQRLTRSARRFADGPMSRNYIRMLNEHFG